MKARCFDRTIRVHRDRADRTTALKLLVTLAVVGLLAGLVIGCVRGRSRTEGHIAFISRLTAKMHVAHHNAGAVACGGKLYVWSGYSNIPNALHRDRTPVMEIYDPKTDTWSRGADVPGKRNGMAAFELDGMIYSVGGEGEYSGNFTNSVYRYDPRNDEWTALTGFPTRIWDPVSVACHGKAYVIGGRRGYGRTYPDVYEYDAQRDTWTKKANMPISVMRAGAVAYRGKVYVFGGDHQVSESSAEWLRKIQVYDPAKDRWTYEEDMPVALSDFTAVICGGRIYLFAVRVYDENDRQWVKNRRVYEYDPVRKRWATHEYSPEVETLYDNEIGVIDGWAYFTNTRENGERSCIAHRIRLSAR